MEGVDETGESAMKGSICDLSLVLGCSHRRRYVGSSDLAKAVRYGSEEQIIVELDKQGKYRGVRWEEQKAGGSTNKEGSGESEDGKVHSSTT